MIKRTMNYYLPAFLLILSLGACKKNEIIIPQPGNSREVKYEITGNFTGKFTVVYSDNINGITTVNNVTLPWSKEITYAPAVLTIGISAQAAVTGTSGQTATLKIYSGGLVVQSASKTAGSLGELSFPSIAHSF